MVWTKIGAIASLISSIGVFSAVFVALLPIFKEKKHKKDLARVIRLQMLIEIKDLIRTMGDKLIVAKERNVTDPKHPINIPKENLILLTDLKDLFKDAVYLTQEDSGSLSEIFRLYRDGSFDHKGLDIEFGYVDSVKKKTEELRDLLIKNIDCKK